MQEDGSLHAVVKYYWEFRVDQGEAEEQERDKASWSSYLLYICAVGIKRSTTPAVLLDQIDQMPSKKCLWRACCCVRVCKI